MKVLVTGVTGFIGGNLASTLAEDPDIELRLMARNPERIPAALKDISEGVRGDTLDKDSLASATEGIDTAYYLIHSMKSGSDYVERDREGANNFRTACIESGVRRIIYLGGLGDKSSASPHLLSRIETGEILSSEPDKIQTVWFRAGVIIGAGSISFQIIRHLVHKLPIMITPRFVKTRTQPISSQDVFNYLKHALYLQHNENLIVDIGAEVQTFKEMILQTAALMGKKRLIIPVPVFTPRLSSYWFVFIAPASYHVARALIEGLKSETVVTNDNAALYFPEIHPMSFREATGLALESG
ncbi:NAD(P)H-binding protein [Acidobacteriota bacterium]